jgi:hypothetical protein
LSSPGSKLQAYPFSIACLGSVWKGDSRPTFFAFYNSKLYIIDSQNWLQSLWDPVQNKNSRSLIPKLRISGQDAVACACNPGYLGGLQFEATLGKKIRENLISSNR